MDLSPTRHHSKPRTKIVPKLNKIDYIESAKRAQMEAESEMDDEEAVAAAAAAYKAKNIYHMPVVKKSKAKSFEKMGGDLDAFLDQFRNKDTRKYCYCQKNAHHAMIGCDDPRCRYQWFHYYCADLRPWALPKGKWFCPDCRKKRKWSHYRKNGYSPKDRLLPLKHCTDLDDYKTDA